MCRTPCLVGVAARLANDAEFNAQLERWFERLGNKFQSFMCDGVAKRLANDVEFNTQLEKWFERLEDAFLM